MLTSPKFKYWEKDNKEFIIPNEMMASWVATVNALEALEADYNKFIKLGGTNEQIEQKPLADPRNEEPGQPENS
jgi:hypothetical protein